MTATRRTFAKSRVRHEKLAEMKDNRFLCPYCGSGNTYFAEDRTVRYRINRVLGPEFSAFIAAKGEPLEVAGNERVLCGECLESSGIPAMCELIFE